MRVTFWGVRGSIPCPGQNTVKYGGNTACLELRFTDNARLVVIDAGSGIRELGNQLVVQERVLADLFLTHTHSDHIVGFPFFAPIYLPETVLKVHGPVTYTEKPIETIIRGQLSYHYFPVRVEELPADITYVDIKEGGYNLGDGIRLDTIYLNHSLSCLGYRFTHGKKVFCTAYDTEPYHNLFENDPGDGNYDAEMARQGAQAATESNKRMESFFQGADLVVYDAQYTQKEYENGKVGWGHSSMETAIATAERANVKRLALFHHDPDRTDAEIDALADTYANRSTQNGMEIFFAREGQQINL
jgi:phosphoribosyl 1,2-cyclic phosphodiesterase